MNAANITEIPDSYPDRPVATALDEPTFTRECNQEQRNGFGRLAKRLQKHNVPFTRELRRIDPMTLDVAPVIRIDGPHSDEVLLATFSPVSAFTWDTADPSRVYDPNYCLRGTDTKRFVEHVVAEFRAGRYTRRVDALTPDLVETHRKAWDAAHPLTKEWADKS
jgi:hypothetical protein